MHGILLKHVASGQRRIGPPDPSTPSGLRRAICLAGLFCLLLTGCWGPGEIQLKGDPEEVKTTVQHVLDAWKSGQKPETLQAESPQIFVADVDWSSERKLEEYKFDGEPIENGSTWRVYVILKYGKTLRPIPPQRACYVVTMGKRISMLRGDFAD